MAKDFLTGVRKTVSDQAKKVQETFSSIASGVPSAVKTAITNPMASQKAVAGKQMQIPTQITNYLGFDRPVVTPQTNIPIKPNSIIGRQLVNSEGNIPLGPVAYAVDPFLRGGRAALEAINLPSYMLGGGLKASREALTGQYQAPNIPGGKYIHPTFVGVARGIKNKQGLMEEAPKTAGLDPKSLPGLALGLAAEIAAPDPLDAQKAGKAINTALETVPEELRAYAKVAGKTNNYDEFLSVVQDKMAIDPDAIKALGGKSLKKFYQDASNIYKKAFQAPGTQVVEEGLQAADQAPKGSVLEELAQDRASARELRDKAGTGRDIVTSFKSKLFDRFAAFENVDRQTYINMRNISGGGSARAEQMILRGVAPVIQKESKRLEDFSSFLTLKRLQELVGTRGLERKQDLARIQEGLSELSQKYGPEGMKEMEESARAFSQFLDGTLDFAVKSGIISEESARAMRESNQSYVAFKTLGQMVREVGEQGDSFVKNSFNVARQNVYKEIGSSKTGVADPIETTLEKLFRIIDVGDKNSILRDFADRNIANENILIPLRQAEKVKERINIFSDLAEIRKLRDKITRSLRFRNKDYRRLVSEINQLQKEGLDVALSRTVPQVPEATVSYRKTPLKFNSGAPAFAQQINEVSLRRRIDSLLSLPSSELAKLKSKIATRENKLGPLFDEIRNYQDELENIKDAVVNKKTQLGELKDVTELPEGWGKMEFFRDGIKEEYAVPKILETAIKNLDAEPMHQALRIASVPTKILKKLTVQYNPAFWVVNPVRDIQDALISEGAEVGIKDAGEIVQAYAGSLGQAFNMADEWAAWRMAGGAQSSLVSEEVFSKNTTEAVQKIKRAAGEPVEFSFNNPQEAIKVLSDNLENLLRVPEETTRLAKFKSDIDNVGMSAASELTPYAQLPQNVREAAFASRNITLDFARSGSWARVANQLIPFFNVGLQGSARFFSLLKNDPVQFGKSMAIFAGVPALIAYIHNRRYEDFEKIAQYEKDGNHIIMIRDRTPEEVAAGEPIKAFKVPKGNVQKVFSNLMENFLAFVDDRNPQKLSELLLNSAEDLSPVGIPVGPERTSRFVGQTFGGIQAAKPFIEWWANRNFFTGQNIVPTAMQGINPREQYDDKTAPLAVAVGGLTGLSPKKIENFIGTAGGTLGRVIADPRKAADVSLGRFYEAREDAGDSERYDEIQSLRQESATESFITRREAEQVLQNIADLPQDQKMAQLRTLAQTDRNVYNKVRDLVKDQRIGLSKQDSSIKSLPTEARAKYILSQYRKLPENERSQFLADMTRKKILTPDTRRELSRLMRADEAIEGENTGFFGKIREFFDIVPEAGAEDTLIQTPQKTVIGAGRGMPEGGLDPNRNRFLVYKFDPETETFRDQWGFAGPLQGDAIEPGVNSYVYTFTRKGDNFVDEFGNVMPLLKLATDKSIKGSLRVSSRKGARIKIPASVYTAAGKSPGRVRTKKIELPKESRVRLKSARPVQVPVISSSQMQAPRIRRIVAEFPKELQKDITPLSNIRI